MGKRSREAAAGETFPEGKSKKRKKDGKEPKEKKKRLRELQKDIVGLPEEEEEVQEEAVEDGEAEAVSKKAEKKEKKRKMKEEKKAAEAKEEEIKESEEATEAGAEEAKTKVSKGDAKNKVPKDDAKNKVPKDDADLEEEAAAAEGRKPRFIVFVGNLPYSATAASIEAHFKPLHPTSIRCLNQRDDPTKCRGCAFVEFTSSKSIRTCLDKWHHSTFDDGVSKARKINVELTAGGGGKKSNRMDKIKEKNVKLNEKRTRRIEEEKKSKTEKAAEKPADDGSGIHPSRRAAMMK